MQRTKYILQGSDVPANLKGTVIYINDPENFADCQKLVENGSEALVAAKFGDGYIIGTQGMLRNASSKDGATAESLQALADKRIIGAREKGVARVRTAAAEVKNTAASQMDQLYERASKDDTFKRKALALNVFTQEGYDEYFALKAKAEQEKAKAAATRAENAAKKAAESKTA